MMKHNIRFRIVLISFFLLFSNINKTLNAQNFFLKGQFWSNNRFIADPLETQSSFYSQLGYIPTISIFNNLSKERLIDLEWAHKINRIYSDQALLSAYDEPYRWWIRYSTDKLEARLGLQKIAFGPAQILRPTSWFDTIDPRDPTGQTKGVEALRLKYFPNNLLSLWTWVMNTSSEKYSYGLRTELSGNSGDWGFTFHQDKTEVINQVGLLPIIMSGSHSRMAIDYRYDGLIGFWFEGASLFSTNDSNVNNDLYNLATIGADYTLPIYNGVLIMAETMQINAQPGNNIILDSIKNINETYSVLMASMPIGLLHQIMAVAQLDWARSQSYYYLRWGITYDRFSLNFSLSANPRLNDYNEYLFTNLSGLGNVLDFTIIYNH